MNYGTKLIVNSIIRGAVALAVADIAGNGGELVVKPTIKAINNIKGKIELKLNKGVIK